MNSKRNKNFSKVLAFLMSFLILVTSLSGRTSFANDDNSQATSIIDLIGNNVENSNTINEIVDEASQQATNDTSVNEEVNENQNSENQDDQISTSESSFSETPPPSGEEKLEENEEEEFLNEEKVYQEIEVPIYKDSSSYEPISSFKLILKGEFDKDAHAEAFLNEDDSSVVSPILSLSIEMRNSNGDIINEKETLKKLQIKSSSISKDSNIEIITSNDNKIPDEVIILEEGSLEFETYDLDQVKLLEKNEDEKVSTDLGPNPDHLTEEEIATPVPAPDMSQFRNVYVSPFMTLMGTYGLERSVDGLEPGEVKISKTAQKVDNMVNTWDITLDIKSRQSQQESTHVPTYDIVLVIDRSGSMRDDGRMASAKQAANSFIDQLLVNNSNNNVRIGIVSFASDVRSDSELLGKTYASTLKSRIYNLKANGGTFTQGGLHAAREMLSSIPQNQKADYQHIVLLSDGVPTYSYPLKSSRYESKYLNQAQTKNNNYQVTVNINNYANVSTTGNTYNYQEGVQAYGSGGNMYYLLSPSIDDLITWDGYWKTKYLKTYSNGSPILDSKYNPSLGDGFTATVVDQGSSTIDEASFAKNDGYTVWSIGLSVNGDGGRVLSNVASEGYYKTGNPGDLSKIFSDIATDITKSWVINKASVTDPIADGFKLVDGTISPSTNVTVNGDTLSWNNIKFTTKDDIQSASLTYRVEVSDKILKDPQFNTKINGDGFYTNGKTTLSYTDNDGKLQSKDFDLPKVKPLVYKITKKLEGGGSEKFDIGITSNNGYQTFYTDNPVPQLGNEESFTTTALRNYGAYQVVETADDYDVTTTIDGKETDTFKVEDSKTEGLIDIVVTNKPKNPATVVIKKTLTGNLKEVNKDFEFTYKITKGGNTLNEGTLTLKGGDESEPITVPFGATIVVKENGSDDYSTTIKVDGKETSGKEWTYTNDSKTGANLTVEFVNEKSTPVPTGVFDDILPFVGLMVLALSLGAVYFIKNKKVIGA